MANISLGKAVLVLGTEIGGFITDLDNAEKHTRKLTDAVDNVGKGLRTMGRETTALGSALSISLTAPILAIGGSALKMGMDVVESENLFTVSFGEMAGAARAWSEEVSNALGLNEFELRRTSGTFFTMFDAMKIGKDAAFNMSTSLVELANDMASFFNLKPEEAFEKLRAGITGEAEPLKQLGILVDETTVKTAAMRHGLIKQGEEMSQQQKVLARYVSIMEQTSKAQGDLARTADSPTNQLRTMRAQFEELAAKLGVALIPAFQRFIAIGTALLPKIEALVNWFTQLSPETQTVIVAITGLVAAIGPVLVVAGTLITSVGTIVSAFSAVVPIVTTVGGALAALGAGPIALIIGAVGAVVAAWYYWDEIGAIVQRLYTAVKQYIGDGLTAYLKAVQWQVDLVVNAFKYMYDAVVGHSYVPDMIDGIKREFARLDGDMVQPVDKAAEKVRKKFAELAQTLDAITTPLKANALGFRQFTEALLHEEPVVHALDVRLQALTTTIQPLYTLLPGVTIYMYDWVAAHERAVQVIQRLNQQLIPMPARVQTAAEAFRQGTDTAGHGVTGLGQRIGGFLENIPRTFGNLQASLTEKITGLFGASTNSVLGSVVSGGLNFVFGPLGGLATQLLQQGMAALGKIALEGLKKIGGFFRNLFGGPNRDELNGRQLVQEFEQNLSQGLEASTRTGEAWRDTVIAIRDKYLEMGLPIEEAYRDAERLWASSRDGAEAAKRVIEEIKRKFEGGIRIPVTMDLPDYFDPNQPPRGGRVTPEDFGASGPLLFASRGGAESGLAGTSGAVGRGGGTAMLMLGGRELARFIVPDLPGEIARYQLGR